MDDDSPKDAPSLPSGVGAQSAKDTLEADVLEEAGLDKHAQTDREEVLLSDVAVTAEFDYIELDDDSEAADDAEDPPTRAAPQLDDAASNGPITRALHDFDSHLDEDSSEPTSLHSSTSLVTDPNVSSPEAWGFEQPQVSGVFSRYEEETKGAGSDDFDLFEEDDSEQPPERTLQEIVNAHEKKLRRLEKRLAYQKEVIQVVSELLVEARVVSKRELKKRLRALRDKS